MPLKDLFSYKLLADHVFQNLPLDDVKNASLVCKSWREMVERRQNWRGAVLRLRDESMFSSPRILTVRKFRIDGNDESDRASELVNRFFSFVADTEDYKVEHLECIFMDLTDVPAQQLAATVCKAQYVAFLQCDITIDQLSVMFTNISETSELHLQTLLLTDCDHTYTDLDLGKVTPSVLASAVCRLNKCDFSSSQLTRLQLEELFGKIADSKNLTLTQLNIENIEDLEEVNEDILTSAVRRLEVVDLGGGFWEGPTAAQIQAILDAQSSTSKLKELLFGFYQPADVKIGNKTISVDQMMISFIEGKVTSFIGGDGNRIDV